VRGDLKAQGLRNGSHESFAPTAANATQTGTTALQQYLTSGLVQIKNNPQALAQVQAVLQNSAGRTLTYTEASGQFSLTVAGQSQVQAVYNTLRLTESFDTKKFADAGTAQIVTLVAAIALTVCTAGAGAASIGAAMAGGAGTSATLINAAVVAMASTMTGQLAAGASFGEAFAAGIKAGATSAMTAGVLNAPVIDTAQGMQSINQLANVQTTGANIVGSFSADTFGQNLAGMAARGVVNAGVNTAIYGGRFGDAFKSSLVSDLAAVGANAVGLSTDTRSPENIIGHAAVGALAAQLKGQDALSGAIGGAGAAIVNPLLDQAIGGATAAVGATIRRRRSKCRRRRSNSAAWPSPVASPPPSARTA
jgi:filamentous hemagglutinin